MVMRKKENVVEEIGKCGGEEGSRKIMWWRRSRRMWWRKWGEVEL